MLKGLAISPPILGRISIGKIVEKNGINRRACNHSLLMLPQRNKPVETGHQKVARATARVEQAQVS